MKISKMNNMHTFLLFSIWGGKSWDLCKNLLKWSFFWPVLKNFCLSTLWYCINFRPKGTHPKGYWRYTCQLIVPYPLYPYVFLCDCISIGIFLHTSFWMISCNRICVPTLAGLLHGHNMITWLTDLICMTFELCILLKLTSRSIQAGFMKGQMNLSS